MQGTATVQLPEVTTRPVSLRWMPPRKRRPEAFAAWRRLFEALAEQRPLVLVFEDLHLVTDDTLALVESLVDVEREDIAATRGPHAEGDGHGVVRLVGDGQRDAAHAERAARAALVLDEDRLPERAAHRLGDQPRDRVGRAAGRGRNEQRDRLRRIGLRAGLNSCGREQCSGEC